MLKKSSVGFTALMVVSMLLAGSFPVTAQNAAPSSHKQKAGSKTTPAPEAENAAPATLRLEPKALELLMAASKRLAAAKTMSFVAVEAFEHLSRQGAPLVFAHRSEVTLQRPDKLRVIQTGDGPASEFYYDGKTMMAFAPAENTVAVMEAPATIDAALETIHRAAATYFPFTDLIVADPYNDLRPGLKHAYYVGQSRIVGNTTTDIVAYNADGVFVQMWIGTEDKLPRLMHAIFLNDPEELRHNLMLSDWKLDIPVPADHFTSSKIAGAKRIPFAHPHPEPASPPSR